MVSDAVLITKAARGRVLNMFVDRNSGQPIAGARIAMLARDRRLAEATTNGVDFGAMVDYAKRVGGTALRRMTFHERALKLKAMAQYLMSRKDEFYVVSAATGATKSDSWVDIEGGIGTFFAYASRGRREFPNETFYVDGPTEMLSKGGTFVGRHICVPLEGVAVHINAFNFPVWGMLEKLAPTLLAGMPAIVKPATVTSYLTEVVFRAMIESGLFPAGAIQLVCGSSGDLLEQAPHGEVERVDVHRQPAARHRDVRARESALLAQRHRGAFVHDVARRQLVRADARVREERAAAAFDVDPAVAARGAGVR